MKGRIGAGLREGHPVGIEILIRYCLEDQALAQRIGRALGAARHRVRWQPDTAPPRAQGHRRPTLRLWTARSADLLVLQGCAVARPGHLELVLLAPALAKGLLGPHLLTLADADSDLRPLLDAVQEAWQEAHREDDPFVTARTPSSSGHVVFGTSSDAVPDHGGSYPAGAQAPPGPERGPWVSLPSVGAELPDPLRGTLFSMLRPEPLPVLLAASAPRHCAAGSAFTACLAAYVEAARESALRRLEQFGETGDRVISDLAPDADARWRVGAPVSVRVAGPHLTVTPPERHFDWNGRENAAAFSVMVDADAPAGSIELCFSVDVAGLSMAFIPMRIAIGAAPAVAAPLPPPTEVRAPRSVFVSYSSKDAASVTQRLSTLIRWSPALDIFQDCLDLAPNEAFKPQLAAQIKARDAFVLFWSRNAAASRWVRWEYETARDGKGLTAILPMPLEDPAIAPPPAEFADAHWRDRFMLAGYALAKIREQVVANEAAATP